MIITIRKAKQVRQNANVAFLMHDFVNDPTLKLNKEQVAYIHKQIKQKSSVIRINQYDRNILFLPIEKKTDSYQTAELARKAGDSIVSFVKSNDVDEMSIAANGDIDKSLLLAAAEGLALGTYRFLKYRKDEPTEKSPLKSITVCDATIKDSEVENLSIVIEGVFRARDLVNEPVNFLNAVQLSEAFKGLGKEAGFSIKVLDKAAIQKLGMGGLLAVNFGSIDPPTFSIMEWKPAKAVNSKPVVLVGKGVVYDTGGLSLKPTLNSMDSMKCDMAGSAAVACTMFALAKAGIPLHTVALVPSTDNRPDGNAYTPGDIIKMYNGLMVEVLNTDAEGRMILGDALSYAKKYNPQLVIDLATLTGAAATAIGQYGIVYMGTASDEVKKEFVKSGEEVYERLVEFPMWDEYDELIKSEIADIKNVGGPVGGAITAGMFLKHFVDYPWLHLDIAGPAFIHHPDSYRGRNATGTGVRLLFNYLSKLAKKS